MCLGVKRLSVFGVPGGLKKFGGPQARGEVHEKCCKGHGKQSGQKISLVAQFMIVMSIFLLRLMRIFKGNP
jgi:hypothetical protein